MKIKSFWIKERINPQLGTYYVGCGQLSARAAKCMEQTLYGENIMHEYRTKTDYDGKLAELRKRGLPVR